MNDINTAALPTARLRERTAWFPILVLWAAGIGAGMQFAKFSVAFDSLAAHYATNSALVGLALSIVGFVGLVFGVSAGVLVGRIGLRKVLSTALGLGALLSLMQSTLPGMEILLATRVLEGASHLGIAVAAPTLMIRLAVDRHHALVMALWGTFFGTAFALAGWAGAALIPAFGASGLLIVHALFMGALMVLVFLLDIPGAGTAPEAEGYSLTRFIRDTASVYTKARTILPGAMFLAHTCMFIAMMTFLPRLAADPSTAAMLLVLLPLTSIAGTFLAGAIAGLGVAPPLIVLASYAGIAGIAILIGSLAGSALPFVMSTVFLFVAAGLIQGASFAAIPWLNSDAPGQAQANGAIAQLGNLGSTIGPPIFAAVIAFSGTVGFVGLVLLLCFGGAVTAYVATQAGSR